MGISFEEIFAGIGRWLDRAGSNLAWWWRMRSFGSAGAGGSMRDWLDRALTWTTDLKTRLSWWLAVRGVRTESVMRPGGLSWNKSWKWLVAILVLGVSILLFRNAIRPPDAEPFTEAEIVALQTLKVPLPRTGPRGEAPTVKHESAFKAWLMSALGLR